LLFVGHPTTPKGTWGNFEETRGGVGKVASWSTKAAISETRNDRKHYYAGPLIIIIIITTTTTTTTIQSFVWCTIYS